MIASQSIIAMAPHGLDPGGATWDNPPTKQADNYFQIIAVLQLLNRSHSRT
jgi:hypothetical protein